MGRSAEGPMQWNVKLIMADCEECEGRGHTTYLHSDSREWGPDFRECACEECDGTGRVEHRCPSCGNAHERECCEICEGCEACCTCHVCYGCGTKQDDGARVAHWQGQDYHACCIEEFAGVWCWEQDRPCDEAPCAACADCDQQAAREQRMAERAAEEVEAAR